MAGEGSERQTAASRKKSAAETGRRGGHGSTGARHRPSRGAIGLALLLLVALLFRLPGAWQNLPFVFHWDEPTLVNLAVWIFTEGSLNPRYFNYPGGMVYLLALLFAAALLFGRIAGLFPGLAEGIQRLAAGTYPRPPTGEILYRFPSRGVPALYILGRLASAVGGTLSVLWTFRLAGRLAGARAAWLAGGLLAVNALHAANSALVTTDIACSALLAWFLWCLFSGASPRRAGIALGLSAAFKYTGGIGLYLWPLGLLLPIAGRREWSRYWLRAVPWALGAFLALNPFVLLTPRAFLQGFLAEAIHMREGTAHFGEGISLGPSGPAVVADTLRRDLGLLPLFGFAFGLVAAVAARRKDERARPVLLLGTWCALYLAQLCTWKTAYPRYLLAIWPALSTVAACGWVRLVEMLRLRARRVARSGPVTAGLVALAALPGLLPAARSVAARLQQDPRVEMSRAIASAPDPAATIATETGGPWIDADGRQVIKVDLLGRAAPEAWRRRGVRYLVATGREAYLPPGSPDSLLRNRQRIEQEARALWREGSYVLYDLGEGTDPFNQARRLFEGGRAREARDRLEELCRQSRAESPALMLLGDAHLALGDTLSAIEAYRRAAATDPRDPTPQVALGMIALELRLWDEAVESYRRAQLLSPRDPVVAHNLSTALLYRAQAAVAARDRAAASRDLDAAALLARMALSQDPHEPRYRQLESRTRELSARWGIPLRPSP